MEADGSPHVLLDLRGLDPKRFPNVWAICRGAGLDPDREPVPVAPAAHYLIGGVLADLDGRTHAAGPARGRRVRVHRPARRQPARLELAQRVLRVRQPRRAARRSTCPATALRRRVPEWRFEPPTAATREAVWEHAGPMRDAAGLEPLLADPYPLARLIAAAALERAESRGAHRRADFPLPDPSLDGIHLVIDADGALRRERWT